jgi:hypothetical protein
MKRIDAWAAVAAIVVAIVGVGAWTNSGIDRLHADITQLRTSVEKMDGRLDAMSERLARVEGALGAGSGFTVADMPDAEALPES